MNTKIALISALAPVSIALAFTFAAPAKASTSLSEACHSGPQKQVLECCSRWVVANKTNNPTFSTKGTCNTAIGCQTSGAVGALLKVCYVYNDQTGGGNNRPVPKTTPGNNGNIKP